MASDTRARRAGGALVAVLAALGLAAGPAAATVRAPRDPAANRTLSASTLWACQVNPGGATCVNSVLSAIDQARAAEGVRPMRLPGGFGGLSQPQQLLVIANLERTDRGLVAAIGLSRGLDANALAAARASQDPVPNPFYGNAYGSNWAGGIGSTLAVDFLWMYDDGPGSYNIDCRTAQSAGCWGHRHNVVYPYRAPLAMGAAVSGTSMTEVFVGGDARTRPGQADAPLAVAAARR
jgi:hypothetical protein